jgi:Bacterial Ig-like domain (group 2)
VNPSAFTLIKTGSTQALTVLANLSTGFQQDFTHNPGTTYQSSNTAVATVDSNGIVTATGTAVGMSTATITAANGNFSTTSTVTLTLPPVTVTGVTLSPPSLTLTALGSTVQLNFEENLSDGTSQSLTNAAGTTYQSDTASVATVSAAGVVTAVGNGTATITASNGASSAKATIIVNGSNVNGGGGEAFSLSSNPSTATISAGQSQTYALTVQANGGFNQPVALACFGAPAGSTCSISPNSINPNGTTATVNVTVTTTAQASSAPVQHKFSQPPPALFAALLSSFVLLMLTLLMKRRSRLALLPAFGLIVLFLVGCGGNGQGQVTNKVLTFTPKGTYTLTVTGTSGNQVEATDLMVVVQ